MKTCEDCIWYELDHRGRVVEENEYVVCMAPLPPWVEERLADLAREGLGPPYTIRQIYPHHRRSSANAEICPCYAARDAAKGKRNG